MQGPGFLLRSLPYRRLGVSSADLVGRGGRLCGKPCEWFRSRPDALHCPRSWELSWGNSMERVGRLSAVKWQSNADRMGEMGHHFAQMVSCLHSGQTAKVWAWSCILQQCPCFGLPSGAWACSCILQKLSAYPHAFYRNCSFWKMVTLTHFTESQSFFLEI